MLSKKRITSAVYLKVLKEQMSTLWESGLIYMQNEASIHTAHIIKKWLADNKIEVIDWSRLITRTRISHPGSILSQVRTRTEWDFFSVRWDRTGFFFMKWDETEDESSLNETESSLHETEHLILILQLVYVWELALMH